MKYTQLSLFGSLFQPLQPWTTLYGSSLPLKVVSAILFKIDTGG